MTNFQLFYINRFLNILSISKRSFLFDVTFLKYTNTCAHRILWTIWFRKRSEFFPISTLHIFATICLENRFLRILYDDRKHHRNSEGNATRYSHFRRVVSVIWYCVSSCLLKDINETVGTVLLGVNNLCLFARIFILVRYLNMQFYIM